MSTLTIQPSTTDSWINNSSPDSNAGSSTQITVRSNLLYDGRMVLNFDFTSLPAGAVISAASLQLYRYTYAANDGEGRTYWVYRLTQTGWVELEVTWNSYKTGSAWSAAGGDYTATSGASTTVPAYPDWMTWNVLSLVQYFQANSGNIANFLIRDDTEGDAAGYGSVFHSREYTTDTTLCPKLVITYTALNNYTLDCAPGSYSITGSNLTPLATRMINASPGSYTISGANATFSGIEKVNAEPGAYAITGANAGLVHGYVLSADPGSYTITGSDATILADRKLNAGIGAYAITGFDVEAEVAVVPFVTLRNPRLRFFDANHKPLVGGKLYLCISGASSITQLKASWADYDKKVLNSNPIILDSEGYSTPIFSDAAYTMFLFDANGVSVMTVASVGGIDLNLVQVEERTWQFWDANGTPLSYGKLYMCKSGSASLRNLKGTLTGTFDLIIDNATNNVYDNAGNTLIAITPTVALTLNPNPIILDVDGKTPPMFATIADFYKIFLFDQNNVPILTQDQVSIY